jgi:flagellar L-ring protein precursor FlgH
MNTPSKPATAQKPIAAKARLSMGLLATSVLCSACHQLPQKATVDFAEPKVAQAQAPASVAVAPASGSLFQTVGYRPAFEDRRARMVGDTVTIQIVENVSASQKSTSTVDRNSAVNSSVTALPLNTVSGLSKFDVGATTGNTFSGKGGTESANTFSGSITATVVEVLPNGHMVVTGEKQIGVNQNVDVLRFSGTVDPRLLQPGSIIASTQVANVRVASRGRGAQDDAQTVGWISRFLLSFNPF